MPLTKLGLKNYYIGIFFKVNSRLVLEKKYFTEILFEKYFSRQTGQDLRSIVDTMGCILPASTMPR